MLLYSFDEILSRINSQYREFHNTNKTQPTGIRYFDKLERLLELNKLEDKRVKRLAYISKN